MFMGFFWCSVSSYIFTRGRSFAVEPGAYPSHFEKRQLFDGRLHDVLLLVHVLCPHGTYKTLSRVLRRFNPRELVKAHAIILAIIDLVGFHC